jgi:hypothetical protein
MAIDSQQLVRVLTSEYNRLGAYVWSITGDSSLCDDVLQEVVAISGWLRDGRQVDGVAGVMYTTWQHRYNDLEAFARQLQAP